MGTPYLEMCEQRLVNLLVRAAERRSLPEWRVLRTQHQGDRIRHLTTRENFKDDQVQPPHVTVGKTKVWSMDVHYPRLQRTNPRLQSFWSSTPGLFLLHYRRCVSTHIYIHMCNIRKNMYVPINIYNAMGTWKNSLLLPSLSERVQLISWKKTVIAT